MRRPRAITRCKSFHRCIVFARHSTAYIVDEIKSDVYTIQQFRNRNVLDPALEKVEVPNPHDLAELAGEIKPNFNGIVKVKSAEFGEQVI